MGSSCSFLEQWEPPSTGTPGRKIQFDLRQEPPAREGQEAALAGPERPQDAVGGTLFNSWSTGSPRLAPPLWRVQDWRSMASGEEEEGEKGEGGQASFPAASHKQPDLSPCL